MQMPETSDEKRTERDRQKNADERQARPQRQGGAVEFLRRKRGFRED